VTERGAEPGEGLMETAVPVCFSGGDGFNSVLVSISNQRSFSSYSILPYLHPFSFTSKHSLRSHKAIDPPILQNNTPSERNNPRNSD
jgi:hypothetical protein